MEQEEEEGKWVLVYLFVSHVSHERRIYFAELANTLRRFRVGRVLDNEHYSNLEALLLQLNPKDPDTKFALRCLPPPLPSERTKIVAKLAECVYELETEHRPPAGKVMAALDFLLARQLKYYLKETEDPECMSTLERLIDWQQLQKEPANKNRFELCLLNFHASMVLDQPAVNALQIFPKDETRRLSAASASSLFELLNRCKTQFGARCLRRWMSQPLQDIEAIEYRLSWVDLLLEVPQVRAILQTALKNLPDLDRLYFVFYKVAAGKKVKCDVADLIKIYRVILALREMVAQLLAVSVDTSLVRGFLEKVGANTEDLGKVAEMVEKLIDLSGKRGSEFVVKSSTQATLHAIMTEIQSAEQGINREVQRVEAVLGLEVEKCPSTTYRYVLEANKKGAINAVKETAGFRFLTAKQTRITFTTDELTRLCERLHVLDEEYKAEQEQVVRKMFEVVAGYYPVLEQLSEVLAEVDVVCAFASMVNGSQTRWCRPSIEEQGPQGLGRLVGEAMYHPCVKDCVENGVRLDEGRRTVVLTGPNMGGKSTYIRTIGICAYLAHLGCFVPASSFSTTLVDAIITRVGASDVQVKGISTFMSEMLESSCLLQTATARSLVLIDELGRGTSTSEGFGIAWALCEYLHEKTRPLTLFATHFHEMTRMADEIAGVVNCFTSCRFVDGRLVLEYRVAEGRLEKSYGIEVMKMLEFPPHVIGSASKYLEIYEAPAGSLPECPPAYQESVAELYAEMEQQVALEPWNSQAIQALYRPKFAALVEES